MGKFENSCAMTNFKPAKLQTSKMCRWACVCSQLLLLAGSFVGPSQAYESPVFVWGISGLTPPAMISISQQEFVDFLIPLRVDYMLVAFVESSLSAADFQCRNPANGGSCLRHLRNMRPSAYYASVKNPLPAMLSLTSGSFSHFLNDRESSYLVCNMGTVHAIYLTSSPVTDRVALLESHDKLMYKITKLQSDCPTVFVYLSGVFPPLPIDRMRRRSHSRHRAEINADARKGSLLHSGRFSLFYDKLFYDLGNSEQSVTLSNMTETPSTPAGRLAITVAAGGNDQLSFDVHELEGGYYAIKHFQFKDKRFLVSEMVVPSQFSYYCADVELFSGDTLLHWVNLQFQLHAKPVASATAVRFAEPWHCTGFMTSAIIGGLFTMSFVVAITACGICWMLDIRSNSCFDDPRKRGLIIVVTD